MRDEDQQQPQACTTNESARGLKLVEELPPPPPPQFSGASQGGNNISTPPPPPPPPPSTAAPPPPTTNGIPQQSIEEFAADNSFGSTYYPPARTQEPATSITFPIVNEDDDHATCVSSTTSPPQQNSDLFVASLYPSTGEIEAWEKVPTNPMMTGSMGSAKEIISPPRATTSCNTKDILMSKPGTLLAIEENVFRKKDKSAEIIASTTAGMRQQQHITKQVDYIPSMVQASHNKRGDLGLGELGKSESLMLPKGQEIDQDSSTSQMHQQVNRSRSTTASTPTDSVFAGMMQVPAISHSTPGGLMPLPPSSEAVQEVPMGPGAHPISTPLTSHALISSEETTAATPQTTMVVEEQREYTVCDCNGNIMGLAEAHPVDALPEAQVKEELIFGEEQHKQQSMKKGQGKSLWGHIAGLSWRWRCILMLLCSVMAANWCVFAVRRIVAWNQDPAMVRTRQSIEDVFGMDYFDSELKEKALHWIVHEDPMKNLNAQVRQDNHLLLDDKTTQLIQRFSLVAIYFQTSARQPWTYCNPPKGEQSNVCLAPPSIKSTEGRGGTRWLSATHECQWMGVSCERGSKIVSTLRLPHNNMTGPLPSELTKLSNLQGLELKGNKLSGSLPVWITQMTSLRSLYLGNNAFAGNIPPDFFPNFSSPKLWLGSNLLTGRLPSQIGLFGGRSLWLSENLLTGPIPDETYNLSHLQHLDLGQNSLTGTISTLVGQLTQLTALYLHQLVLTHSIPTEIGFMGSLQLLQLSGTNLEGTIPEELYSFKGMSMLDISNTNIGGTISSRLGQMTKLETCLLANTNISGTIPEQLTLLSMMQTFQANGNPRLSGSIPEKFCTNKFQHCMIVVDCSPSSSSGKPAVACPKRCCSSCCDVETKICSEQ